jgi:Swt1-like HEPN
MATTNHERVGKALELLKAGLGPFAEREFTNTYQAKAASQAALVLSDARLQAHKPVGQWDVAALLKLMWDAWNEVFRKTLGQSERSLVQELREVRNRWAHQHIFSTDDTYRAMDSAARLLTAVSAPQADDIEKMKLELLRLRFDEQVRGERRRAGGSLIEAAAASALKPWREVVTSHAGVDTLLAEAGVKSLPKAKRVVLVGNRISPGNPVTKPDGAVTARLPEAYQ